MDAPLRIEAVRACGGWKGLLPDADLEAVAQAVAAETEAAGEVALALTDDMVMAQLNADFRGKDKPTNVLSFPSGEESFLGDIAISLQTLVREASEQGKSVRAHALHLLVHGILHLLGYDHEADDEADAMESLERRILKRLDIADPYGDEPQAQ